MEARETAHHSSIMDSSLNPNNDESPFRYFLPPGVITVTTAALRFAQDFAGGVNSVKSKSDWVAAFEWSLARTMRYPDGREIDLGAGLDLGAYRRSDLPPEVIQRIGDLEFVIKIPREVWEASEQRLIDYDPSVLSKVILR
jgi:hypothetical protein